MYVSVRINFSKHSHLRVYTVTGDSAVRNVRMYCIYSFFLYVCVCICVRSFICILL